MHLSCCHVSVSCGHLHCQMFCMSLHDVCHPIFIDLYVFERKKCGSFGLVSFKMDNVIVLEVLVHKLLTISTHYT